MVRSRPLPASMRSNHRDLLRSPAGRTYLLHKRRAEVLPPAVMGSPRLKLTEYRTRWHRSPSEPCESPHADRDAACVIERTVLLVERPPESVRECFVYRCVGAADGPFLVHFPVRIRRRTKLGEPSRHAAVVGGAQTAALLRAAADEPLRPNMLPLGKRVGAVLAAHIGGSCGWAEQRGSVGTAGMARVADGRARALSRSPYEVVVASRPEDAGRIDWGEGADAQYDPEALGVVHSHALAWQRAAHARYDRTLFEMLSAEPRATFVANVACEFGMIQVRSGRSVGAVCWKPALCLFAIIPTPFTILHYP